jgi:hypothetical protein
VPTQSEGSGGPECLRRSSRDLREAAAPDRLVEGCEPAGVASPRLSAFSAPTTVYFATPPIPLFVGHDDAWQKLEVEVQAILRRVNPASQGVFTRWGLVTSRALNRPRSDSTGGAVGASGSREPQEVHP